MRRRVAGQFTLGGTLKCEIVKPVGASWNDVGDRMRALRKTVAPALTMTMRELFPNAMDHVDAVRRKDPLAQQLGNEWQSKVEKTLRDRWNTELGGLHEFDVTRARKERRGDPDARTYLPVTEYLSAETRHHIIARFAGESLKDIIASRASVPSWKRGCAFYARSRECKLVGPPDAATITFPLWGGGKKSTTLVVAPCGDSHRAMWRKLVANEVKPGRVGIARDDARRKWYALISWTDTKSKPSGDGQHAAVNLGVNVFLKALADDGAAFVVDGQDILVTRKRFAHRQASLQRALNTMGSGSRGHGKRRRLKPVTDLENALGRYCETKSRQVAAELIRWCSRHDIGTLHLEDLSGLRDGFEAATGGEAPAQVKRMIHSWPFYALRMAIEREAVEHDIKTVVKDAPYVSQRCPACGHTSPENVTQRSGRTEYLVHHGRQFSRVDKRTVFECQACGLIGDGDLVACANHLVSVGRENPLRRARRKAMVAAAGAARQAQEVEQTEEPDAAE